MDTFEKEVVLIALREMFVSNSFSICTVDKCLKLTGAIPNAKDYEALSALHCIVWMNMSQELRKTVFEKTVQMLSNAGFDLSVLEMIFDQEKGTLFKLFKGQ